MDPAEANIPSGMAPAPAAARSAYPFSAIGYVETRTSLPWREGARVRRQPLTGTAFMISPCYALTAFHVVFGNDPAAARDARQNAVWISLGGAGGRFIIDRVKARAIAWGNYADDQAQDWALLEVSGCPGARADIGWLEIEPSGSPMTNRTAEVGGFSRWQHPFQFISQTECRLTRQTNPTTIMHGCMGEPGMSGGPIMVSDADHRIRVAAITSRKIVITPGVAGYMPVEMNFAVVARTALEGSPYYSKVLADMTADTPFQLAQTKMERVAKTAALPNSETASARPLDGPRSASTGYAALTRMAQQSAATTDLADADAINPTGAVIVADRTVEPTNVARAPGLFEQQLRFDGEHK